MNAVLDRLPSRPERDTLTASRQDLERAQPAPWLSFEELLPLRPEVRCLQRWIDLNA